MSTQNDGFKAFTAAAALSAYTRVTIDSSGYAAAASTNNKDIGVTQADAALGDPISVRLYHKSNLVKAAGAITAGSQVYPAASGQVSGSATGNEIGIAAEAATAAGDVIEICPTLN